MAGHGLRLIFDLDTLAKALADTLKQAITD